MLDPTEDPLEHVLIITPSPAFVLNQSCPVEGVEDHRNAQNPLEERDEKKSPGVRSGSESIDMDQDHEHHKDARDPVTPADDKIPTPCIGIEGDQGQPSEAGHPCVFESLSNQLHTVYGS